MDRFIQQYPDVMSIFPPEKNQRIYQGLIHRTYYAVDYTPDREALYDQLCVQLHEFIQGFHDLYQRVKRCKKYW